MARRRRVALGIAVAVLLVIAALLVWKPAPDRGAVGSSRIEHPRGGHPPPTDDDDPKQDAARGDESQELGGDGLITHRAARATVHRDDSPHGALVGRVFSWSTRKSIARAELGFVQDGVVQTLETDEQGGYRFVPPTAGEWRLATLTAEGYLPYAPELGRGSVRFIARKGRRIERADLFLYPAVDYVGRVVDESGRPVADATIELFGAASGERSLIDLRSEFRSDADGEFVFHAPDYAVLEATHPDHPAGRAQLDDAAIISHTLTITLGRGGSDPGEPIRGTLVTLEGDERVGIEGIEVEAEPASGVGALARTPTAITAADGSFVLAPLDANDYIVSATLPKAPRVVSEVVQPGATIELIAEPGLTLRVQLRDPDGAPIPSGSAALVTVEGVARRHVASLSFFDPEGEFGFEGIAPGDYEIQAIAQGYARAEPLRVSLPTDHQPVELTLEPGAVASGRVIDAESRQPLELALVTARGIESSDSVLPSLTSTITNADGEFELFGLDHGRLSLQAVAFGHHAVIETDVVAQAGLELELPPVAEGERPKTEITGIGVEIAPAQDAILINNVIAGGGAEQAGLVSGDQITAVDGESVTNLGFEDAVQNIRGQAGTKVTLDLTHKDSTKTTVAVKRRLIRY